MTSHKYTNKLIEESSPYLLQHAHNPVNWYPWGEEALEKAKRENKPIIVSVGYSACHWCHVMEKESFENEAVAMIMNEKFVSIKVDREERPDIDQVYMNAVQLINGSGGWPLNCIALPDGRPVYGGTYFPRENWMSILTHVHAFMKDSPDKAEEQAKALTDGVKVSEELHGIKGETLFEEDNIDAIFRNWKDKIDYTEGGHKGAPKFPLPVGFRFLLRLDDEKAMDAVNVTLDKMAMGGIYDQIGGGFARYATDDRWIVPHFEKMLYDNAQLVTLYSEAYQKTKKDLYKEVVEETLSFVKREMTSPDGGFYSAYDADSEGIEGAFYTWKESELRQILNDGIGSKSTDLVLQYYSVLKNGNWEDGTNILYRSKADADFASKNGISEALLSEMVRKAKRIIFDHRKERIHPGLDDKILTGWNGLMLKGCVDAYRVFDDKKYLDMALSNAEFITNNVMEDDFRLFRNFKNGKATINGFLDDYAFTIEAFIALYQATFDEKWLNLSLELSEYTVNHFYDESTGMFFYTSDLDKKLIARKKEISDNVIPASNSQMAINFYLLGDYYGLQDYTSKAVHMASFVKETALRSGAYLANWDILILYLVKGLNNIAVSGDSAVEFRREFYKNFLPNAIFSGSKTESSLPVLKDRYVEGSTKIYVCRDRVCKLPFDKVAEALKVIQN